MTTVAMPEVEKLVPHSGRMVLLLDPAEVLTRAEQGLLDKFVSSAEPSAK